MQLNWDYIAGFFDGEGSLSMMNFTHRDTLAAAVVTISQSGDEGLAVLTEMQTFLAERGIKAYLHRPRRIKRYRPMHNLKICARPSVSLFLQAMLPRVRIKRVVVQDVLRFFTLYPSIKGPVTAERNRATGRYGALNLNPDELRADLAAGMTRTALAAKHNTNIYTIHKYLDPDYRKRYDAYRKRWREKRIAKAKEARAAENAAQE
jgi:hypothetical protein